MLFSTMHLYIYIYLRKCQHQNNLNAQLLQTIVDRTRSGADSRIEFQVVGERWSDLAAARPHRNKPRSITWSTMPHIYYTQNMTALMPNHWLYGSKMEWRLIPSFFFFPYKIPDLYSSLTLRWTTEADYFPCVTKTAFISVSKLCLGVKTDEFGKVRSWKERCKGPLRSKTGLRGESLQTAYFIPHTQSNLPHKYRSTADKKVNHKKYQQRNIAN